MEWAELILNFVGQIAWPLVVLALGFGYRKQLMGLLTDSDVKMISAGPGGVSVERAIRDRVDKAEEALEARKSDEPKQEDQEPEAQKSAPAADDQPSDTTVHPREPPRKDWNPLYETLTAYAADHPASAILRAANVLESHLRDLLTSVGVPAEHLTSLLELSEAANRLAILDGHEVDAVEELAGVVRDIKYMGTDIEVSRHIAAEYVELCLRIAQFAEDGALRLAKDRSRLQSP